MKSLNNTPTSSSDSPLKSAKNLPKNANNAKSSPNNSHETLLGSVGEVIAHHKKKVMAILIGLAGYTAIPAPTAPNANKEPLEKSELIDNRVDSFEVIFGKLKAGEFVMMDRDYNIIGGKVLKYPKNWETLSDSQKQQFYDKQREKFSEKYGIPATEKDMPVYSANSLLKNVEKGKTYADIVKQNSSQIVIGDPYHRTRQKYLEDAYANFTDNKVINEYFKKNIK